jgi:organic hydroperoxide reductase OsmC/OhrA
MKSFPHLYTVSTQLDTSGLVALESDDAPSLSITAPIEFEGPEGDWSPETLLVASVASCFLLSFRAIARGSKLEWNSLSCDVVGVLDRIEKELLFTEFHLSAKLTTDNAGDNERIERLLKRAEETCLISSSLKASTSLTIEVNVVEIED